MDLRKLSFVNSVFILLLSLGYVQNRSRIQRYEIDGISDPTSDIYLNSPQLITKYKYSVETHTVITDDGYQVTLFRIPGKGPPVLLAHGIGDSSDCWLVLGPTRSLAYYLADFGFDVWLYNARGNKYSHGNVRNLSNKEYWNFSFEEMGTEDLPSTIDYILNKTSQKKLSYVGYSQGTTIFFIMCSRRPEYNKKIKQAILLAPVAYLTDLKYPFRDIITQNLNEIEILLESLRIYEVFPSNPLINSYHAKVCDLTSPLNVLCQLEYYTSFGLRNISNFPEDRLPVITSHIPAGTSAKVFLHFLQLYKSKMFRSYDYGTQKNLINYGSVEPPAYDLSLVKPPVTLIYSEIDWFSTFVDVQILRTKLPNIVNYIMFNKTLDFTHLEFVYGVRAKALVNEPIVRLLTEFN